LGLYFRKLLVPYRIMPLVCATLCQACKVTTFGPFIQKNSKKPSDLSSVSSNIPVLSSTINKLMDVVERVEQTATNQQGLLQIANQIKLLVPIVSNQGRLFVEVLKSLSTSPRRTANLSSTAKSTHPNLRNTTRI